VWVHDNPFERLERLEEEQELLMPDYLLLTCLAPPLQYAPDVLPVAVCGIMVPRE